MSSAAEAGGALALADRAYALVQVDPRRALPLAERAVAAAAAAVSPAAEIRALHALSWAQQVLGDGRADATLRAGIRAAERAGDRRSVALLRRRRAISFAFAGRTRAAAREIDAAIGMLAGRDRAESEVFRIEIHRRGQDANPETDRAVLAAAARGLRRLRRDGDTLWEARLLYNRGLLFFDRGELREAERDLRAAGSRYRRLGAVAAATDAEIVLAEIGLLRGDLLACLRTVAELEATLPPDRPSYNLAFSRTMALIQARLLPEARASAEAYARLCARTGRADYVGTALLDQAATAILSGDAATARLLASRAARSFAARGKPADAALARGVALRARLLGGQASRASVRSALEAAAVLERAGRRRDALRTRLLAARAALAAGATAPAREQLELALPLRVRGTVADRIELCHVRALLHLAEGDGRRAERLLGAGLRLVDEHRAALGAAELRATASGLGAGLAEAGLRIALGSGRPEKVLAWAERLRAGSLRLPPVRPPSDPGLRRLQTDLRRVVAQARTAERRGRTGGLEARRAELESAIRSRTRLLAGAGRAGGGPPRPREAAAALGDRVLVEYVELDGGLAAVTLAGGRLSLHELGAAGVAAELDWLRFALARLARGRVGAAERAAVAGNARASAAALDRVLVEPLAPALGDGPLVLVPTGPLHAVPWGSLPSLRRRPVTVAPSLAVWLELAARAPGRRRRVVLAAGPRLRHAAREVRELAALRPGATVLAGRDATAPAVLAALEGAGLAHLACHGRFRSDSPLFSSLELADGPLDVYELQRLRRVPELVVLSACDVGVAGVHPGDELLGLAAALVGMGTRSVVASVVPVPDAAARRTMVAFHRRLLAGDGPAEALARAQADGPEAGFVCLGSGE